MSKRGGSVSEAEKRLVRSCLRNRTPLPSHVMDCPVLEPHQLFYMDAFSELDTERSHGMGFAPIPHSKIVDFAVRHGMDYDMTEDLIFIIRRMDGANRKNYEESMSEK